jgi:hypothetical protein
MSCSDDDDYDGGKVTLQVGSFTAKSSPGGTKIYDLNLNAMGGAAKKKAEYAPDSWRDKAAQDAEEDEKVAQTYMEDGDEYAPLNLRRRANSFDATDSDSDFGEPDEPVAEPEPEADARSAAGGGGGGQQFEGEFKWDGFEAAGDLMTRNADLLQELDEKGKEVAKYQTLLTALEPVPGLDPEKFLDIMVGTEVIDQDYRDAKIMELAKKNRGLNVKMESEKAANLKSKATIEKLEKQLAALASPAARAAATKGSSSSAAAGSETDRSERESSLKEENKVMQKRVNSMRMKMERAAAELKQTQRCLAKEVGESVPMAKILEDSENNNWRGRAQQISMLKTKLKRAENQLAQHETSEANPNFQSSRLKKDVDIKAQEELQSMEQQRKEVIEQITLDNEKLSADCKKVTTQKEAAQARARVLEKETKKQQTQLKTMVEKSSGDDQYLDALRNEVVGLSQKLREAASKKESQRGKAAMDATAQINPELERTERRVKAQDRQLQQQETLLSTLRQEISSLRDEVSSQHKPRRPNSRETRELARNADQQVDAKQAIVTSRAQAVEISRLSELCEVLKQTLAHTETKHEQQEAQNRKLTRQVKQKQNLAYGATKPDSKKGEMGVAELTELLAEAEEENEAIRDSFRGSLENSEREVQGMRDQAQQQKQIFDATVADLKEQLHAKLGLHDARQEMRTGMPPQAPQVPSGGRRGKPR